MLSKCLFNISWHFFFSNTGVCLNVGQRAPWAHDSVGQSFSNFVFSSALHLVAIRIESVSGRRTDEVWWSPTSHRVPQPLLKLYRNFKLSAFERLVLVSWILLRKAGVPPLPQANLEYGFLEVLLERVNVLRVFLMAMVCKDSPRSINGTELVSNSSNIFVKKTGVNSKTRWWFQRFFSFIPIWGRFPIWLLFFKWVETTNQKSCPEFFVSDPSSTGYVSTGRFSTYGRGRDCTRRFVDGYVVVNSFGCQR